MNHRFGATPQEAAQGSKGYPFGLEPLKVLLLDPTTQLQAHSCTPVLQHSTPVLTRNLLCSASAVGTQPLLGHKHCLGNGWLG